MSIKHYFFLTWLIKHCRFVPGDDVVVMAVVVSLVDVLVISPDVEVSIKITWNVNISYVFEHHNL